MTSAVAGTGVLTAVTGMGYSSIAAAVAGSVIDVDPLTNAVSINGYPIAGSPFSSNWAALQGAVWAANPSGGDIINLLPGTFSLEEPMSWWEAPWVQSAAYGSVQFDWYFAQYWPIWNFDYTQLLIPAVPAWAPIMVDRPVTFRGQKANDSFLTTITGDQVNRGCGFLTHNDARVRFENLKFTHCANVIMPFAPYDVVGCWFEETLAPINGQYIDERIVFPNIGSGDLNTYRESLIVDNDFMKNFLAVGWFCSGQTFWKNRIGNEDYPAVHPDDPYFYGATICESYSKLNGGWPWLQYGVRDGNVYQCHVRDNKIDNTLGNDWFRAYEGETGIWAEFAFFMGNHGYGSEHRHCSISGNNVKNARVRAYGIWAGIFWGPNFGQNALSYRDIAFDNNFFDGRCYGGKGIELATVDLQTPVRDIAIYGNRFADVRSVDGWYGQRMGVAAEWWRPGAALTDIQIFDNDFTESGMPPIGHPYADACVFLDDTTSNCFVDQGGFFPQGQGGAKNHITDWGTGNRVVGQPANTSYRPAGRQPAESRIIRSMSEKRARKI